MSREISRMAVLGTPSVSLGEVGKTDENMVTNIALSGRHHPTNPLGSQKGKVLSVRKERYYQELIPG